MKSSPRKTLGYGLGAFFLLLLMAKATWLGVNLWPRPLEPELYSEAEITLSPATEPLAWDLLPKTNQPSPKKPGDLAAADEFTALIPDSVDSQGDALRFWNEAGKLMPALYAMIDREQVLLQNYKQLMSGLPLIDRDPVGLGEAGARILYLHDLHKIGLSFVGERFMAGDSDDAFSLLLSMIQQDLQWAYSARSLISQLAALQALRSDLSLALLIRYRAQPPHWEKLEPVLRQIQWQKITPRRSLVFEYRSVLKTLDKVIPDVKKQGWWVRLTFNPSLVRRDLNHYYRDLEAKAKNPGAIRDADIEKLDREMQSKTRGLFWWFMNPGGKLITSLVAVNPLKSWRSMAELKQDSYELHFKLLGFKDATPAAQKAPPPPTPQEPVDSPAPTPLAEKHPETAPESHPSE